MKNRMQQKTPTTDDCNLSSSSCSTTDLQTIDSKNTSPTEQRNVQIAEPQCNSTDLIDSITISDSSADEVDTDGQRNAAPTDDIPTAQQSAKTNEITAESLIPAAATEQSSRPASTSSSTDTAKSESNKSIQILIENKTPEATTDDEIDRLERLIISSATGRPRSVHHLDLAKMDMVPKDLVLAVSLYLHIELYCIINAFQIHTQLHSLPQNLYKIKMCMNDLAMIRCSFANRDVNSASKPPAPSTLQLLQYPSIKLYLKLDHITVIRKMRGNWQRDILIGSDVLHGVNVPKHGNEMRPRREINDTDATEAIQAQSPKLSKLIIESYFTTMTQCMQSVTIPETRRSDLQTVFNALLTELGSQPLVQLKLQYVRYVASHRFVRLFGENTVLDGPKSVQVRVREIVNPENCIRIVRCPFVSDVNEDEWTDALLDYFERILVQRDVQTLNGLVEMFTRCVKIRCTECNVTFDNADAFDAAKKHVQHEHNALNLRWTCVRCNWRPAIDNRRKDQTGWVHKCR